jgi:ornithine cyclodeaminase/alanine dehydrogenase-like protein (mu-crystallin family)
MGGVVPSLGVGAIRINSDIVHWPYAEGGIRRVKIPLALDQFYVGLVLLFSSETGEPLAMFPDGFLQRMRVGAASGLAAKYLARADASTVGLLGAGWQAGAQLMALWAIRQISNIRVFSPNPENCRRFAAEMSHQLGLGIEVVGSAEDAVCGSDIVHCATNALQPVLDGSWLAEGSHVACIRHCELDASTYNQSDIVILHWKGQFAPIHSYYGESGAEFPELQTGWTHPQEGDIQTEWQTLPDIGDLLVNRMQGRTHSQQRTCFVNNIGMGLQFAAVGARVLAEARSRGLGREIPTDWLVQSLHP